MASPVTIQPSTADSYFDASYPTVNYGAGANTRIFIRPKAANGYDQRQRIPIKFDFSAAVPVGATISLATLSLNARAVVTGRTITVYRLLRTDWVETEITWNVYKTGSSWGTAGALNTTNDPDYTATDAATSASLASAGWQNWTVTAQVQTALDSVSGIAHFLIADDGANASSPTQDYWSRRFTTNTSLRPKLYIEYTVPSAVKPNFLPFFWA